MTIKPQSTTEALEPCPFCGAAPNLKQVPSKTQSANYWWIGCEIKGTPQKDLIGCGIGHSAWSKDEVIAKWNTRISPASAAPVEENVGLNLLRQLVGGKNSLRTLGVFPCNQAEHEDVDCKCFWEQCEAWARQDASVAPVGQLVCAKCGKPRMDVSAESFLCRYCFSTESITAATAAPMEQTSLVSDMKTVDDFLDKASKEDSVSQGEVLGCREALERIKTFATNSATTSLIKRIAKLADEGSAVEFGDADERLRAIAVMVNK